MIKIHKTHITQKERGQGLVEFALILPLLLILILGVFEFGHLLFVYSAVNAASREAARYGTAAGAIGVGGTPRYLDCAGITSAARRIGGLVGVNTVTIAYDKGPGGASLGTCASPGLIDLGARIIITANATYDPFIPIFDLPSINVSSTVRRTIMTRIPVGTPVPISAPLMVTFTTDFQATTESAGTIFAQLKLSSASFANVSVPILVSGTATNGEDYTINTSFPVVIPAGSTTADISISIADDGILEDEESIVLAIGLPNGAIKGTPGTHTIAIAGTPFPPNVQFGSVGITRNEDSGTYQIPVVLNKPWTADVSVAFNVMGGTATSGVDYQVLSASPLVIPAGSTTGFIDVLILDDLEDELDETFLLELSSPVEATLGSVFQFSLTILDDDMPVVAFLTGSQVVEESVGTVNIPVVMDRVAIADVTIPFTVTGTATGADYVISASPVFIPQGSTQGIISVLLVVDSGTESSETIVITLGTPTNAMTGTPNPHTVVIKGDSAIPSVTFSQTSRSVNEDIGIVQVQVLLSEPYAGGKVIIPFSVSGSATGSGVDYTILTPSPLEIPAGSTQLVWNINIQIVNDLIREGPETIILTLGLPTNANLGGITVHTVTINFSDPYADLSMTGLFSAQFPQAVFKEYDITFNVNLSNAGPDQATNLIAQVTLPTGYLYKSHTSSISTFYIPATNQWAIGTLPAGSTVNLTIIAKVQDTGPYNFYAQVWSVNELDPDSVPGNNSVVEDDNLTLTPVPESKCALSSPGYTIADTKYTWVIDNNGTVNYRLVYIQVPWKATPAQQFVKFSYNGVQIGGEDTDAELLIGFEAAEAIYGPADPNFPFDNTNALTRQLTPGVGGTPGKGTIAIDFKKSLVLQSPTSTVIFQNLVTNDTCVLVRGIKP